MFLVFRGGVVDRNLCSVMYSEFRALLFYVFRGGVGVGVYHVCIVGPIGSKSMYMDYGCYILFLFPLIERSAVYNEFLNLTMSLF